MDWLNWCAQPPDLFQDPDAEIEWWFFHCTLTQDGGPTKHLMAAFFRLKWGSASKPEHMLLTHEIDADGRNGQATSQISEGLASLHHAIAERFVRTNFSKPLAAFAMSRHNHDTLTQVTEHQVEILKDPVVVDRETREIRWHDFGLCERDGEIKIRLVLNDGQSAKLTLAAESVWLCDNGRNLDPDYAPPYTYVSCPRLAVTGEMHGTQANGIAWFDRQTGSLADWFYSNADGRLHLHGWDWLGLSLDDGTDLLSVRPFRVGHGALSQGYTVVFNSDGVFRLPGSFSNGSDDYWNSPRTGAHYPIRRRLILPELGADIVIEPIDVDQEIPVFGAPAIWEGAVRGRGRLNGRPVAGNGRLELFGYGYADTIGRYSIRHLRRLIGALTYRTALSH